MATGFAGRLKEVARTVGGQDELATKSGVPKGTLASYTRGASEPSVERLVALARAGGVSVEWLATGANVPVTAAGHDDPEAAIADEIIGALIQDFALIPHLDVEVSTGSGALVNEDETTVSELAFLRKYLKKRGVKVDDARLVTARGDSMEPTIGDGDTLLVDTSVHEIRADSIYCIQIGGNLRAKRLQRDMRGGVWVISDNPQYEDEHLSATDAADLQIAGRVVWIGRDV